MLVGDKKIIEFVDSTVYRPMRLKELARQMNVENFEYPTFRRQVKNLINSGKLSRLRGGRIGLPEKVETLVGILSVTKGGRAFFLPEDGSEEVVIRDEGTGAALNGDKVEVAIIGRNPKGRVTGEVLKVLERKLVNVVGTFHQSQYRSFVRPDDSRLKIDIRVTVPKGMTLLHGMKVVVHLEEWSDADADPTGKIINVLGMPTDPGVDVLTIIHQYNLPLQFPHAVEAESEGIPEKIPDTEVSRRLDLRHKTVFTIDPEDAKDHDDAISLEVIPNGYQLGVHIADVSHYVVHGSHLDKEAKERTSSAYLVDRVLPMLPERLSNNICSLKEGVDRLTMTAMIDLDQAGNVMKYKLYESVICSKAKLSYDHVQNFLDTGKGLDNHKRIGQKLKLMQELALKLIERRMSAGALDFELPEYKVILDDNGHVARIVKRERKMSHRIVEEFMLLANKVVATEMLSKNIPSLYRVHPSPDEKKLESFRNFAENFGHRVSFGTPPRARFISDFILSLKGRDEADLLNELLVRSMQKAFYQPENIGHFGLAFSMYLHFTSPIRRYPDLIVHRMLKQLINGEFHPSKAPALKASLTRIGKHCSEQEIIIMQAERDTIEIKQAEFLSRQLGEIFEGVISGMLSFGFFVRILDVGAEGLVRLSTLTDDFYTADLENLVVVGKRTHRRLRLGDKVRVQIANVNLMAGEVDLNLVEEKSRSRNYNRPPKAKRQKRGR